MPPTAQQDAGGAAAARRTMETPAAGGPDAKPSRLKWLAEVAVGSLALTVFAAGVVWTSHAIASPSIAEAAGRWGLPTVTGLLTLVVGVFVAFVARKPATRPDRPERLDRLDLPRHFPTTRGRADGGGGAPPPPPWLKWLLASLAVVLVLALGWNIARRTDVADVLMRHSFAGCALFSVAVLQFPLRPARLRLQTWKKLADVWLKLGGVTSLSLGTIGVLVSTDVLKKVSDAATHSPYVDRPFLILAFFVVIGVFGLAALLTMAGRGSAPNDDTGLPRSLFVPAFATAWVACVGFFALFFDTLLLGMHVVTLMPPLPPA